MALSDLKRPQRISRSMCSIDYCCYHW